MANPEHERLLWQLHSGDAHDVDLSGSDLSNVLLWSAKLSGAKLAGANLQHANLSGATLQNSNLSRAQLRKASLTAADLRMANLSEADLTGSDLRSAILVGANLAGAKLVKASLVKATFDRVDLSGADLSQADLRGATGLTAEQLGSARNVEKAILDQRMQVMVGLSGDRTIARHGRPKKKSPYVVDLRFSGADRPGFGDVFLLCGGEHPKHPPTGDHGFARLADLGVEQVDDYFAICRDGDPVIWIFPLINGSPVCHHSGPFDGLRVELTEQSQRSKKLWTNCLARLREELRFEEEPA